MLRFASAVIALLLHTASSAVTGSGNPDPTAVIASSYTVEPVHTRVQFTVSHMGFTNWHGDFSGASGNLRIDPKNAATSKVEISIPTASVSTTNTILYAELKIADWFDAARFPTIRFASTAVVPTGPGTADITGDLTFHGITM